MRLSDVLSKPPSDITAQVEGFLDNRRLGWGRHKRVRVGQVIRNFYCTHCADQRSFVSADELYCLGLGDQSVSIDATLKCAGCETSIEAWFLLESEDLIFGPAPLVRIRRYTEDLRAGAHRVGELTGPLADLVGRARLAHESGLGAGSMIYVRQLLESVTGQVAEIAGIPTTGVRGRRRPFKDVLKDVNEQRSIIPHRFSGDGYRLFSELSEVIHNPSEGEALRRFEPCLELVLGVVDEVSRDQVFSKAIEKLGWNPDGIDQIAEGDEP